MYCVSRMTEFWGSYGESGGSYIREAKGGSFTGLLPGRIALIELDTERGTYIVSGRDGGIIAMSTIKRDQKASDTDFRRVLLEAATDAAIHFGAKNAFVLRGSERVPLDEYEAELFAEEKVDI
ncbi:hypothetical protein FOA26_01985 [Bacillus velezensis]|uniref:hypothetical protein n=1 Tax=Bacillus velezensis TaxID=492670 RepID=UPI001683B13A|nr:hypothetical protein [Bacillus velezensis]QNV52389.1 hypothetical protein GE573_01313 [Bacillus velezensis]